MVDPITQLCQIIVELLRDAPEVEQTELVARVERAIAANAELASALKTDQRVLQIIRDGARGFQTLVEEGGKVFIEGTHYHLAEPEKFEAVLACIIHEACQKAVTWPPMSQPQQRLSINVPVLATT